MARVSTIATDKAIVAGGYATADIMQLCRVARQRGIDKGVKFDSVDTIYSNAMTDLQRNNFRCSCCKNEFAKSTGRGPSNRSMSLHRVIASQGYVTGNVKVICGGCNVAIGETNTYADIVKRVRALRWQAKEMMRAAKKMLEKEGLIE